MRDVLKATLLPLIQPGGSAPEPEYYLIDAVWPTLLANDGPLKITESFVYTDVNGAKRVRIRFEAKP